MRHEREQACACPGCLAGHGCYLRPDTYAAALRSPAADRRLMAHTIRMLHAAVPADRVAFAPVDEDGNLCHLVSLDATRPRCTLEEGWAEYVLRYRELDPFAPARHADDDRPLVTIDDLGGWAEFGRTAYARELLPELGYGQELRVYLRDGGTVTATVSLVRRPGEARFDADELAFLRRAQPAIELAYTCARAPQPALEHEDALRARGLTARERDVARLVAGGATNREVARALLVSESTVKTHLKRVYAKLDVHTRTQLALRLGPAR